MLNSSFRTIRGLVFKDVARSSAAQPLTVVPRVAMAARNTKDKPSDPAGACVSTRNRTPEPQCRGDADHTSSVRSLEYDMPHTVATKATSAVSTE